MADARAYIRRVEAGGCADQYHIHPVRTTGRGPAITAIIATEARAIAQDRLRIRPGPVPEVSAAAAREIALRKARRKIADSKPAMLVFIADGVTQEDSNLACSGT